MATIRVYEVAEELGVDSKQLIHMLHEMDVRVRSHMSSVTEDQIARLHARLERERRTGAQSAPEAGAPVRAHHDQVDALLSVQDGLRGDALDEQVLVVDADNKVVHAQLVTEITDEPDYDAALAALG